MTQVLTEEQKAANKAAREAKKLAAEAEAKAQALGGADDGADTTDAQGDQTTPENPTPAPVTPDAAPVEASQPQATPAVSLDIVRLDNAGARQYVRTYSQAIHGDGFATLAQEFLSKFSNSGNYQAVDSESITNVAVMYRIQDSTGIYVTKAENFSDKKTALARSHEIEDAYIVIL